MSAAGATPAHPYVLELHDVSKSFVNPDGKVFQIEYATKAVDNSG